MTPTELTDTASAVVAEAQEATFVRGMAFDDFIAALVQNIVSFALHLAGAIIVFYLGRFLIGKLYKGINSVLQKRSADPSLASFVLSLVRITLYFLLIIIVIGILGIETSSFIALFASAGVAVGMALSGTLQNFAGGVLILLLKPYKVGETIEAQGFVGTVKKIEIFSTILLTPDGKTILIPNGPLSTGSINNYSRGEVRRVEWTVSISYGDDYELAISKLRDIIAADDRVIAQGREVEVMVGALGASSVDLTARAWVDSSLFGAVSMDLNKKILLELPSDEENIHFPFPQLDVHIAKA